MAYLQTFIQATYSFLFDQNKAVGTRLLAQYLYSFSVPKDKAKLVSYAAVVMEFMEEQSVCNKPNFTPVIQNRIPAGAGKNRLNDGKFDRNNQHS